MQNTIIAVGITALALITFLIWFIYGSMRRERQLVARLEKLKLMYKPFGYPNNLEIAQFIKRLESVMIYNVNGILKPDMKLEDISEFVYDEKELDTLADDIAHVSKVYGKDDLVLRG